MCANVGSGHYCDNPDAVAPVPAGAPFPKLAHTDNLAITSLGRLNTATLVGKSGSVGETTPTPLFGN
jgi:hypothetical protein